ncbi:laccase [Russula earlei]|uniref:Laccase n=1 Tax=Russula earlei TaxID=71964 RepID=A0ACC0UB73_9AGAM|nr:laccase [Russula earlei]
MLQLRSFLVLLSALSYGVSASIGPDAIIPIFNREIAPDGYLRPSTLAWGTFPGPVIRANKGDELKLAVVDLLDETSLDLATSIHWHGLFQKTTNYDDGPAFVTQCPIVPREYFIYDFKVPGQAGTFWYHSHFKNQYCDGLRGALIISDPNDPQKHLYDVDDDTTVITLADWYHYLSPNAPVVPTFNSSLINGKGRYPGGPSNVSLAIVNVQRGTRYRFRLVSISCDPSFTFSIDGHQMTVIEVEGTNVKPLLIDSLEIFAGQRYSVVVTANQPVSNYWIRSIGKSAAVTTNFSDFNSLAVLHYAGAPNQNPTVDPTTNIPVSQYPLVETNLHPLAPTTVPGSPVPGGADININLNVVVNFTTVQFEVNGVAFEPPSVPVLLQILSGAQKASDLLPKGSIYGLDLGKSVELTIPGGAVGGPHPVHLHGHNFHVVRSAGNSTYNFNDPVIRDVVSIGLAGDDVTIRFMTDNPGPWFFHCHIDWHLNAGFAVVFAEDVPDVKAQVNPPQAWENLCPRYNNFIDNNTSSGPVDLTGLQSFPGYSNLKALNAPGITT